MQPNLLAVIANLSGPAGTATDGRSKQENCEALEQMRQVDRGCLVGGEAPARRSRPSVAVSSGDERQA